MSIIKVSWDEIAERVKAVNPEAFDILDNDPDIRNHYFEIWQYKYGDKVGDTYSHFLPDGTEIKENIPFGMFLSKQFDFYIRSSFIKVYHSFAPGDFIYTGYITKDPNYYYSPTDFWISAGTIQPIFACRVADEKKHRKFYEHFDQHITRPYLNTLHFSTIRELSNILNVDWHAEFLRFPIKWTTKIRDSKCHPFKDLIYQFNFKKTAYSRHTQYYEYFLSKVRRDHTETIFNNAYASQVILHLFSTVCDHIPIHTLATNNEALPTKEIQQAYLDIYKTEQAPFILTPSTFNQNPHKTHYFSLTQHTEGYRPSSIHNTLQLCSDIRYILQTYASIFKTSDQPFSGLFLDISQNLQVDIIHERQGGLHKQGKAYLLSDIDEYDPDFCQQLEDFQNNGYDVTTPSRANFFNGGLGLSFKDPGIFKRSGALK